MTNTTISIERLRRFRDDERAAKATLDSAWSRLRAARADAAGAAAEVARLSTPIPGVRYEQAAPTAMERYGPLADLAEVETPRGNRGTGVAPDAAIARARAEATAADKRIIEANRDVEIAQDRWENAARVWIKCRDFAEKHNVEI